MSAFSIRPYDPLRQEAQAYALWQGVLGNLWPLSREMFRHVSVGSPCYQPGDHFVAEVGRDIVGFAGTQARVVLGAPQGELMLIMVASNHQRKGIGRRLHDEALAALKQRGVAKAQLGAGGLTYFWAGVPVNLPNA